MRDDGQDISITVNVRDATVAARLEQLRPDGFGRMSDTQITWPGRTTSARVSSVTTDVALSSRLRTMTLMARRQEDRSSGSLEASTGGYSAEDLVELGMRVGLFGEPNPLGTLSFMADGTNPLTQLQGLSLNEGAYTQVAELLITEELLRRPGVDHVTHLQIGTATGGRRRVRLGWMPRQRYTNVLPEPRSIDGDVPT